MKKEGKFSLSGIIAIALLLTLVMANAVWLIVSWHGGALIALTAYLIITFLCLRRQHFQEGIIAGVIGFGIHLFELIVLGTGQLTGMEHFFFYANLILPVPLATTSYLASRKGSKGEEV